ncbi:MAG: Response regulator receiver protein [Verrucomicrobiales bacterium]|nr:Response regulator receiver protein [Verrucomicrobiales bacterium]
MTPKSCNPLVAIVDDDESVRIATDGSMRSAGYPTSNFASAEEFLVTERLEEVRCVILDLKLNGMDGLELQGRLAAAI